MHDAAKQLQTFVWRRLDQPGHDVCRLFKLSEGWRLEGVAIFFESGRAYDFRYKVTVDQGWKTQFATVLGHAGQKAVDLRIRPISEELWQAGSRESKLTERCLDVDLGFSPSTNMLAIRRLALKVGQEAAAPAAWLNYKTMRLSTLPQGYRRVSKTSYQYEAPTVGYRGTLLVSSEGAVVSYPKLFERLERP